jgi:imidazolonepropionase-like amidohydrolase
MKKLLLKLKLSNKMQKKLFLSILCSLALWSNESRAQENVYPAPAQKGVTAITHATIHVGNGTVLEDASIVFENGKIKSVGKADVPANATIIDAKGKQVYPGFILPSSDIGLHEVGSGVRGSNDYFEIGENNANIRSIVAYNADSKIIGVLRENGILLAGVAPNGALIEGMSSVVQFSAWNYEDAAYKLDHGLYINFPSFVIPANTRGNADNALQRSKDRLETIRKFFVEAKAYAMEKTHVANNLRFEAVKGLFNGNQKLFVRANEVKQMLLAIDLAKSIGCKLVIVGGADSHLIANLLVQNEVAVILDEAHALPATEDDDVDQPYKTAAALQKAGVLFCINDTNNQTRYRNLAFNAGTAAAYGLTKEEALSAITLNTAKILDIADKTGSLEVGKDANIIISDGDALDMRGNIISHAFIQGRNVSLDNKGKQLYERYKYKYGIK